MVRCGLSHVLLHQEHVHIISDTPEKDQSEMQKASKMKWGGGGGGGVEGGGGVDAFTCFLDEDMLKQVVRRTNNHQGGT